MKAIGDILPPSGRKHKYCLCLIDQNFKWAEVVPLRNLSMRTACDALLGIVTCMGILKVIYSDQGINFKSHLSQEFENRLGTCFYLSTLAYPASNGAVEEFNCMFTQMLHYVIHIDPVNCDKHISYC